MNSSVKENVSQSSSLGNVSQATSNVSQPTGNTNQTATQHQNHGQSPQSQYQQPNQVNNNEGNFKKNRTSAQGTPVTSTNSINTNSQVQQQGMTVGTGSNYIPNNNNQMQQPVSNNSSNSNQNIPVSQVSKISE